MKLANKRCDAQLSLSVDEGGSHFWKWELYVVEIPLTF